MASCECATETAQSPDPIRKSSVEPEETCQPWIREYVLPHLQHSKKGLHSESAETGSSATSGEQRQQSLDWENESEELTIHSPMQTVTTFKHKKKKKKKRPYEEHLGDPEHGGATGSDSMTGSSAASEDARLEVRSHACRERKRKSRKRRLEPGTKQLHLQEYKGRESGDCSPASDHETPGRPVEMATVSAGNPGAVIVWDSQVCDGYKRASSMEAPRSSTTGPSWNGRKDSDVLQELLKNSSDKAYGTEVLTWDGTVSAISQDAIQDSRDSKYDAVIDEWDEEFDSGKVKKSKKFKRERRRSFNVFQKLQSRRNFWSMTHPGKFSCLSSRL